MGLALLTILLSGITAALVSFYLDKRFERRKLKFELLRSLVGNRAAITPSGTEEQRALFFASLNTVLVVFHDNPCVLTALRRFKTSPGRDSETFTDLVSEICRDLNLKYIQNHDDLLVAPFTPRGTDKEDLSQT